MIPQFSINLLLILIHNKVNNSPPPPNVKHKIISCQNSVHFNKVLAGPGAITVFKSNSLPSYPKALTLPKQLILLPPHFKLK